MLAGSVRSGAEWRHSPVLLEPYYDFRLEVPEKMIGRAMADVEKMSGAFSAPMTEDGIGVLTGYAPVASMRDYPREVAAYTKGAWEIILYIAGIWIVPQYGRSG